MTQHAPADDAFSCSHGQRSLWLINQIDPYSAAYNLHAALRIPFPLQPAPLAAATAALIERHETLRTAFDWDGYEPVQRVMEHAPVGLQMADLQGMTRRIAEDELALLSQEAAAIPFDLNDAPLLRLGLVQMPGGKSVLLVTIHHIIADAWSMNILLRDLLELYVAEVSQRCPDLPDLPVQYVDFAAWQRDLVDPDRTSELVAGWRQYLDGTAELDLPTDHPRPPYDKHHGDHVRFRLPRRLSRAVLDQCRALAVTPYVVISGCFAEVLHRYSGCDDFMIGMPTAGRDRPDLEDLIGFFVRTLVLRMDVTGAPSLADLSQRISWSVAEALALQDLPFEQIVEMIDPDRDLNTNPLFQVTSQFLSNPMERANGSTIDVVDVHRGFANFDLTLDFWDDNGMIAGRLEYASALFDRATIDRMIGHLTQLLDAAVAQPDVPLSALDMLIPDERAQVLDDWSIGALDGPEDTSILDAFAETAAAFPDAPALRDAGGDLSYGALDDAARGLAAALVAAGVAPGDAVGLGLLRSRDQIIAALAILMAGGAYVALDPGWPCARTDEIMKTADIAVVIAVPDAPFAALIVDPTSTGTALLPADIRADDLAYIAFTSGSTGMPKGVPTTHRAVVRLMRGGAPFAFAPGDVMLGFAPLGFDASTFEIWGPLLGGGCLALAPEGPLAPHELAATLVKAGITKAWLTAGYFAQMSASHADDLAQLDVIFAGGDALPDPAVRRVLDSGGTVINGYGPTENTVFTCYDIMTETADIAGGVRIGRPVPGTWIYVLDDHDRPVPIGVPGELVAGGFGVSRGYLGAGPAGAFTDDPLYPERGPVYRTGDLVRWDADGRLAYLGRRDRQVKVRGFRIELGEVERAITGYPGVAAACVAVRGQDADDKALVAFVVFKAGADDVPGLRRALRNTLPTHARPSALMLVEALPLNENGKVDLSALLAMEITAESDPAGSEALTEIEDIVADTFADVLARPAVPVDQPFFDLGGHSLHATRVVTRLRERLDVDLPLQAIFEDPTVRRLAARLEDILLREFETEDAL